MLRMLRHLMLGLLAVGTLACASDRLLSAPDTQDEVTTVPGGPSNVISDAAHSGGTEGFYFLPPLVAHPSTTGAFDPSFLPNTVVRVCELGATGCVLPAVVEFTSASGSGSEVLRVGEDHYIANWHTDESDLDAATTYRIEVEVNGSVIGFADVDVVTNGGDLRSVETGDFIGLLDGRTLPIKFRLEHLTETPALFQSVSAGGFSSCGLTNEGAAFCWGQNAEGQLGNGSNTSSNVPVAVSGGLTFRSVTAGYVNNCGLATTGLVYCWGSEPIFPNSWTNVPLAVAGGLSFQSVSAGGLANCGLTASGAYCWGTGGYLGDGTNTDSPTPVAVSGGLSFLSLNAGGSHSCGVTTTGLAYCWGSNVAGQLGDGTNANSIVPVAVAGGLTFQSVNAGFLHSCGTTTAGVAYCWGTGLYGKLGDGSNTSSNVPVAVSGGLTFQSVSAGRLMSCGITAGGTAYCWGNNTYGELGDGTFTDSSVPVAVTGGLKFQSVSAGDYQTCGLTTAGDAYCWGLNQMGQLGNGTNTNSNVPVLVRWP